MKQTVLVVLGILGLLIAIGFFLARPYLFATSRCSNGVYALPTDARIVVYWYEGGAEKIAAELSQAAAGDDGYTVVARYLEDAYCDPVHLSFVSFAPGLVIETDQVRINIQTETVVISIRESSESTWRQGVRGRTAEDDRIVERLTRLLEATAK